MAIWNRRLGALSACGMLTFGATSVATLAFGPESIAAASTTGSCLSLGSAGAYSEYSTGTALVRGDTTAAGVAYGGQASLSSDAYAATVVPSGQLTLVAGSTLSGTNVTLDNGSAEYVGPLTGSITTSGGGSVTQVTASGLPFQFSTAGQDLSTLSVTLGGFATTGTIVKTASTITLTGTGTGAQTNMFDVSAPGSGISSVVINAPLGGVAVVNVDSASVSLSQLTVTLQGGITPDDVIFNLPTAVSVDLTKDMIPGTILAPGASVTMDNVVVNGGGVLVDVANFSDDNIMGQPFDGCVPSGGPGTAVPESPSMVLLPAAGIVAGGLGLAWRRRRQVAGGAIAA
jgi:choice-of-anchor A domain-containing protein